MRVLGSGIVQKGRRGIVLKSRRGIVRHVKTKSTPSPRPKTGVRQKYKFRAYLITKQSCCHFLKYSSN